MLFSPERETDAARIAVGFTVLLLPFCVVGPFAGVFLDRWRRQRVLVRANVLRVVFVLAVAALLLGDRGTGPGLYAAALAAISINRFYLSALSASLPHVVVRGALVSANSLTTTSGTLAALVGGGIGLGVRALSGADDEGSAVVALLAAAGYLAAALVARTIARERLGPLHPAATPVRDALAEVVKGLVEGARHVRQRPRASAALLAIGAHRFAYGLSLVATLLLYRNYFDNHGVLRAGLGGLAEVSLAVFAGIVVAALVTPALSRRVGLERVLTGALILAGTVQLALGLPYALGPFLGAALLLGISSQGSKICVDTIVQEAVADDYRGRVFSFYDTLFNLTFVGAAAVGAAVLPASGKSYPVLVAIAATYLLAGLAYAAAVRRMDAMGTSGIELAAPAA
ncbi:MAG TPA: MFS transporter [Mycobacteriales bacterium]|nr:MFS transporter [Mycobacteriales bacterium]